MRKLYLHGEINERLFVKFSKKLDALIAEDDRSFIEIELSSEGGLPYWALAIYGKIVDCPAPVQIAAIGPVMSAATILLVASEHRYCTEGSWFMVHDASERSEGTSNALRRHATQVEREEQQWAEILAGATDLPAEEWRKMSRQTTYLDAKQMLQFGIVNQIISRKDNKHGV